jgi:hypothetical protein
MIGISHKEGVMLEQAKVYDQVLTAEAAAAATLLLTLVPSTNRSLRAAASVRPSLARSRPSVIYCPTYILLLKIKI